MEVLGGMGYVEETPMPMLYREAPLNGIWEGSGNVICLDILRTLARDAGRRGRRCAAELDAARGADARYDAALDGASGRAGPACRPRPRRAGSPRAGHAADGRRAAAPRAGGGGGRLRATRLGGPAAPDGRGPPASTPGADRPPRRRPV